MRVSREELLYLKQQIEKHTGTDPSITDVIINYQVKKTGNGNRRLLQRLTFNNRVSVQGTGENAAGDT